jgi:small subunit ribosomal protein S2
MTTQQLSLMNLHTAGAHRGNHKSRCNSRLKSYIHTLETQSGLAIIDLNKTIDSIETVKALLNKLGQKKRQILIVGTSKYICEYTKELSGQFGVKMPFVNKRWPGGTLTNWGTINKSRKQLEKLENIVKNTEFFNKLSRNEQLSLDRQRIKMDQIFSGLKDMRNNKPGAVIILDVKNHTAILEAQALNIPVVLLTNLNSVLLPKSLQHTIVFNNTSRNAVKLITEQLVESYNAGLAVSTETTPVNKENSEGEARSYNRDRDNRQRDRSDRNYRRDGDNRARPDSRGDYRNSNTNNNRSGSYAPRQNNTQNIKAN